MEALVAVGFAANILQFVDYVCSVVDIGNQLRRNGMTESNIDLERTTKTLEHQIARIRSQHGATSGVEEADQALDKLAEECLEIAKELMAFIEKFNVDRDSDVVLTPIPGPRAEHFDEIKLKTEFRSLQTKINALDAAVTERKEKEKLERAKKDNEERQRIEEEKRHTKELRRSLLARYRGFIKERAEYFGEAAFSEAELSRIIEYKRKLREELEIVIIRKGGGIENASGCFTQETRGANKIGNRHPEPPKLTSMAEPKCPDEIELDQLLGLKSAKWRELEKVRDREDRLLAQERHRAQEANQKAQRSSTVRKSIKTMAKAIRFAWDQPKIEELTQRLDRMRSLLYSEVMMNIQKSVGIIKQNSYHTGGLLARLFTSQSQYQVESQRTFHNNHLAVEDLLNSQSSQLLRMDEAASQRHNDVVRAISAFTELLKGRTLFPALPDILTQVDPSLKPAALDGFEAIENAVLAALYFRRMDIREAQVQQAYKDTCTWVYEDPEEHQKPWNNFRRWLEEESGCYWIEGKAGCGKSTLMKFLRSDPRTHAALQKWTGSDELIIASYFFWITGTDLQKNQEGLFRSLLHTILSRRRDLIARVFPTQYNAMMTKLYANNTNPEVFFLCGTPGCSGTFDQPKQLEEHQMKYHHNTHKYSSHNNDACGFLTLAELKNAFTTLAKQNLKGFKICLLVDGLDEYVGDQLDIADLFKGIMNNSAVMKAVISSRPEPAFVEAFHKSPKLRVENLTAGDIEHYVRSRLLSHSKLKEYHNRGSDLGEALVSSIAAKASGVFLWVFLVVRSLLECLSDGSYPEDLKNIIETYPQELHELYEHMFERMKPSHRDEAFRIFQAIHLAQDVETKIPSALRLSFLDRSQPHSSITSPLEVLTADGLQERLTSFETRLRSRCCGLFEVQYHERLSSQEISETREGRVTYLHRTVSDFLNDPGIRKVIERGTLPFSEEIYERLIASILQSFKAWGFFFIKKIPEWDAFIVEIKALLIYCQRCESQSGSKLVEYVEEFDRRLSYFWQIRALGTRSRALGNYDLHWAETVLNKLNLKANSDSEKDPLLSLVARYGMGTFICQRLQTLSLSKPDLLNSIGREQVSQMSHWAMHHPSVRLQYLEIIERILHLGLDVNKKVFGPSADGGKTLWQELLYSYPTDSPGQITQTPTTPKIEREKQLEASGAEADRFAFWCQLLELLLKFGAHLDVSFKAFKGAKMGRTAREVILEMVISSCTKEKSFSPKAFATVRKSKALIHELLVKHPMKTKKRNEAELPSLGHKATHSVLSSSIASSNSEDGQASSHYERRGSSTSSINTYYSIPESPPNILPKASTVQPSSQPCYRCKATEELMSIGFEPGEVFEAMILAGVGHDVSALTIWLLDNKSRNAPPPKAETFAPTSSLPLPIIEPKGQSSIQPAKRTQVSTAKQWKVVTKPVRSQEKQVVGAQWVSKSPKKRSRKPKAKETPREKTVDSKESGSTAGTFELKGGAFTWFFESINQEEPRTLSSEQQLRLEEFVKSLDSD